MNEQKLQDARERAARHREQAAKRYPGGFSIEQKSEHHFAVYGWGEYPESSVLAGQTMKQYIDGFDSEEEARAVWPELGGDTHRRSAHNTTSHLPDENTPARGGMYPDDYDDGDN
jgi:hypothetical protein